MTDHSQRPEMTDRSCRAIMAADFSPGINVFLGEPGTGETAVRLMHEMLASTGQSGIVWDEPETGLHPAQIGTVVETFLFLQRLGAQIFIATHSYVVLKEIDLQTKWGDSVRYHSLWADPSGEIVVSSTDEYAHIIPNPIAEVYADLYDRDVRRALLRAQEKTDAV